MTTAQAKRYILAALVVTAFMATAKKVTKGEWPSPRPIVGAFFGGMILSLIAEAAPKVAGGVALTIGFVSVIDGGADVIDAVGKGVTKNRVERPRLHQEDAAIARDPNAPVLFQGVKLRPNEVAELKRRGLYDAYLDAGRIVAEGS